MGTIYNARVILYHEKWFKKDYPDSVRPHPKIGDIILLKCTKKEFPGELRALEAALN